MANWELLSGYEDIGKATPTGWTPSGTAAAGALWTPESFGQSKQVAVAVTLPVLGNGQTVTLALEGIEAWAYCFFFGDGSNAWCGIGHNSDEITGGEKQVAANDTLALMAWESAGLGIHQLSLFRKRGSTWTTLLEGNDDLDPRPVGNASINFDGEGKATSFRATNFKVGEVSKREAAQIDAITVDDDLKREEAPLGSLEEEEGGGTTRKVYDGEAWQPATRKIYTGSEWVEA